MKNHVSASLWFSILSYLKFSKLGYWADSKATWQYSHALHSKILRKIIVVLVSIVLPLVTVLLKLHCLWMVRLREYPQDRKCREGGSGNTELTCQDIAKWSVWFKDICKAYKHPVLHCLWGANPQSPSELLVTHWLRKPTSSTKPFSNYFGQRLNI